LFIKIWLIEQFGPKKEWSSWSGGSQEKENPTFYTYILDAVVLGFIFMVPSVIKGVAVERQTGIKVDMKC
jgi:hypothetical protein